MKGIVKFLKPWFKAFPSLWFWMVYAAYLTAATIEYIFFL